MMQCCSGVFTQTSQKYRFRVNSFSKTIYNQQVTGGHSTRVGAAQDLVELDIDLAAITQAGGWKSTRMPMQYAEKINAGRSGMARAARKSGRDGADD
jgi:hypothetical protein